MRLILSSSLHTFSTSCVFFELRCCFRTLSWQSECVCQDENADCSSLWKLQTADDSIYILYHPEADHFHFSHWDWQMWTIPLTIINLCLKWTGHILEETYPKVWGPVSQCYLSGSMHLSVIIPLPWIMGQEGSEWCFDRDEISLIKFIAWARPPNLIIPPSQITRPSPEPSQLLLHLPH